MIERAQDGQVGLGSGAAERRDDHEAHEREDQRAAREAVEAVGEVDAVAGGHDGERREQDVRPGGSISTGPQNGTTTAVMS